MWNGLQSRALNPLGGSGWRMLFLLLAIAALSFFAYVVNRRLTPLLCAAPDPRFDHPWARVRNVLHFWLAQWKQPRYRIAGVLHIAIFAGFIILAGRSISLVLFGILGSSPAAPAGLEELYSTATDYAATLVFLAVILAAVRRVVFRPKRYEVRAEYGKAHTREAIGILALIATLMLSESLFQASCVALGMPATIPAFTLAHLWYKSIIFLPGSALRRLECVAYLLHDITFFGFLCLLPFGKHFHVVTSLFNVFFAKLDREQPKPVRWGVSEEEIANAQSFGVKRFQDFTWKQMLDCYSCADCGRCSDQCPSNAVGRPLSPSFLTIKARDYSFLHYPVFGRSDNGSALIGSIYSEDEIWSCTTCGACEEECPLLVEYIDKIVDLRRGLVDEGSVPATIQKPLKALESRGNPYGKPEKRRGDWAKELEGSGPVAVAHGKAVGTLYFVDSITSYDDRMQSIARATARILFRIGEEFAILGPRERDSGHEVRRFGEEMLFFSLRDHNAEAIKATRARRIVTSDPHALNALKHDYNGLPPVDHIGEVMARAIRGGTLRFGPASASSVYTLHDPCYLGRHNRVYDAPRDVLDAIPGMKRVEMRRCRDRSFCCGGGGLMLFYEPKEDERMGVRRVRMAAEAGANVIVTACPFCLANLEDAIKVAGLEESMTAVDLAELADRQLARPGASAGA